MNAGCKKVFRPVAPGLNLHVQGLIPVVVYINPETHAVLQNEANHRRVLLAEFLVDSAWCVTRGTASFHKRAGDAFDLLRNSR